MSSEIKRLSELLQGKNAKEAFNDLKGKKCLGSAAVVPAAVLFGYDGDEFNAATLVLQDTRGGLTAFASSEKQLVKMSRDILRALAPSPQDETLAALQDVRDILAAQQSQDGDTPDA